MATLTLEGSILTSEAFTVDFVRSIRTVAVVVTSVAPGNAFPIRRTSEFRGRAFAVLVLAQIIILVVPIGAVVLKIAGPSTGNASLVFALELGCLMASWALFWKFVRA